MPQLSLGTELQSLVAQAAFVDQPYGGITTGTAYGGDANPALKQYTANFAGIAGYSYAYATGSFDGTSVVGSSYFSLMKGTVPSAITDINANQRNSDILVTYTSQPPAFNGGSVSPATDFVITRNNATVNWSPNGLSFTPRYPVRSGTPTWFWLRSYGNEHTVYGTVGATGSGSDLELDNYGNIDATQQFTLYLSSLLNFTVTRNINY